MTSLLLLASLAWGQDAPESPDGDPAAAEDELPPIVKLPELLDFVQAPYPEEAKADGIEAVVLLLIEIDEAGKVSMVEILEDPGYGFGEAALEAAWKLTFTPAEDTEGPTAVAIEFEYGFVMDTESVEGAVPQEEELPEQIQPQDLPVNLQGSIIEMATRQMLPEMIINVQGTDLTAQTDAEGRFEIRGVPPGTWVIQVARPGWETKEITAEIVEGELTEAEIWIRNENYGDDEVVGVYRKNKDEITRRTISMNEVRSIPGTFGDPVRVIQNLPGAARSPFGTGLLVIRGANPEDSGVYIDGIRIPLIYHLGGFVSVFNPDLVESVDYLPGSYGVQYGRSMGGAIDVTTKKEAPEQARVAWSTDLLDSGGVYEARLGEEGKHHIGVAARRSYVDVVIRPFQRNRPFVASPRWIDYQLRYGYTGLEKTKINALVLGFDDKLILSTPDDTAQGSDQDTQGDLSVNYWTHRAILNIEHEISPTWSLRFTPSFGVDYTYFGVGQAFSLEQTLSTAEVRLEVPWKPNDKIELVPGMDFIGGGWKFETELPFNPETFADFDPLGEREAFTIADSGTFWAPDTYLKVNLTPFDDDERLFVQSGLRLTTIYLKDQTQAWDLDPRLAARLKVLPAGFLKASTGIYTQPPQPFEAYAPNTNGTGIGFESAWASSIGWEQQITPAINVDFETFYKDLDDLIVTNPNFQSLEDSPYTNDGEGEIYGAEIIVRHEPIDRFFGWVSYTLSQSSRHDYPDDPDDVPYLFDLDQTHILTVLGGYKLPYEFEVSGRFQYVTGNPYTPYDGAFYDVDQDSWSPYSTGDRNTERLPSYVALDLRAEKGFTFKKWRMTAYVDFLNAYRGENPEFVLYNYDYTESAYVRGLPFIPSPGVDLEFYL